MPALAVNRKRKALAKVYPAPVGGWNARDALSAMAVTDAVRLDNLFPNFGKVSLRRGHASHATGLSTQVQTLAEFNAATSRKMIAGSNGKLWDVTSAGAAVQLATGFTSNKWQTGQFDDASGGARMGLVNGADAPQIYDGSTVGAMTVSGVGLTVANLVGIHVHQNRSYFWAVDSQDFWYSAVNALGGVLTKFPLGRVQGFGGNLVAMGSWSVDAGDGPQDLAVFLMSSGSVIVYGGSDPGSATDWGLLGIYQVGEPIGYRALAKVGSEIIAITKAGYIPMSQAAKLGLDKQTGVAVSNKIHGAALQAVTDGAALGGWQAVLYPRGNYLMVNVPITQTVFHQHVMNTQDGTWCRFLRQNGYSWCVFNNRLYFGGDGEVFLADEGRNDDGLAIQGDGMPAWNYLQAPGMLKRIGMVRVLGQTEAGVIPFSLRVGLDYREPGALVTGTVTNNAGAAWDDADWDTSDWPTEVNVFDSWNGAVGLGDAVAARLLVSSDSTGFDWFSTTYTFEPGGIL